MPHFPKLQYTGGRVSGRVIRRQSTQPMLIAYVAIRATMAKLMIALNATGLPR